MRTAGCVDAHVKKDSVEKKDGTTTKRNYITDLRFW